jgi:hypothetical protein
VTIAADPKVSAHIPVNTGVLTKVDIMDRGTDCRDILMGRQMRLKHGWVAVVNRGQADINGKVRCPGFAQQPRRRCWMPSAMPSVMSTASRSTTTARCVPGLAGVRPSCRVCVTSVSYIHIISVNHTCGLCCVVDSGT